ncbi:MAG: hypothetical protein N2Z85_02605 [Patescibacteria group bacterium]|nr:hypothetical protein [Patescibacteria group bacterium]
MALTVKKLINSIEDAYDYYEKKTDWGWFRNLWRDETSGVYDFFELYKNIKGEETKFSEFEKGWDYRNVKHESYSQARIEWINLLIGWY